MMPSRPGTKSSAISHAPLRAGRGTPGKDAHDCLTTLGRGDTPGTRGGGGRQLTAPLRAAARGQCQHGGRARPVADAQRVHGRPTARGGPRPHVGRAVRSLVRRRRGRGAARAQRRRRRHRGRRRGSRRADRARQGLRPERLPLRHELRIGEGRPAGGEPAGGAGVPLARAAAPGARHRTGRAGRGCRFRRSVGPPAARLPAGRRRIGAIDGRRFAGGAGRAGAAARRADARGEGAASGGLGRLPGGAGDRGVLAGREGPAARPAEVRAGRRGGRRLDRAAPGSMTSPVDPVEGGAAVEEPVSVDRRRGWAIDTTPLRNRHFRRLFGGTTATALGQQMTLVAVPFQVYELTHSSLLVGVTSIVALVPLVVFGLLGGAIADAMDRRKLMLITSSGAAITSALLAVQALLPGGGNLAVLWVLAACVSGFAAVNQPTRSAVIPALVGPSGVAAANALSMTVRQAGVIVGPLIAGVLIGLGDLFLAYTVDAIGFLIATTLLRGLPSLPPGTVSGKL